MISMDELDGTTKLPRAELLAELKKARGEARAAKDKLYLFVGIVVMVAIVWGGTFLSSHEDDAAAQNRQCIKAIQISKNGIPLSNEAIETQSNLCAKMFPVSKAELQYDTEQQIQEQTGQ